MPKWGREASLQVSVQKSIPHSGHTGHILQVACTNLIKNTEFKTWWQRSPGALPEA